MQYSHESRSYYSPVLVIKPTGSLGKKCSFYLRVVPESNIYSLHKFSMDVNNIDCQWYFNNTIESGKLFINYNYS